MAGLTTHVLDTAHGCPAAGMEVVLFKLDAQGQAQRVKQFTLNADGRCDTPLLSPAETGRWRLSFAVALYFQARGVALPEPPFLDVVSLDFGIADTTQHYHVPLLMSPWSYSTYRGS